MTDKIENISRRENYDRILRVEKVLRAEIAEDRRAKDNLIKKVRAINMNEIKINQSCQSESYELNYIEILG
ncbi:hypothetical protein J4229_03110 [Candidatus Pacearchaeota archaeon]|nr:hypothetical protein [Candidatus Pacearchaeota archaeon]